MIIIIYTLQHRPDSQFTNTKQKSEKSHKNSWISKPFNFISVNALGIQAPECLHFFV